MALFTLFVCTIKLKWLGNSLLAAHTQMYIENCFLGKKTNDIFNKICAVYRNNELSFSYITCWHTKYKSV